MNVQYFKDSHNDKDVNKPQLLMLDTKNYILKVAEQELDKEIDDKLSKKQLWL